MVAVQTSWFPFEAALCVLCLYFFSLLIRLTMRTSPPGAMGWSWIRSVTRENSHPISRYMHRDSCSLWVVPASGTSVESVSASADPSSAVAASAPAPAPTPASAQALSRSTPMNVDSMDEEEEEEEEGASKRKSGAQRWKGKSKGKGRARMATTTASSSASSPPSATVQVKPFAELYSVGDSTS